MKGILLAGGTGSRLAPISNGLNKHLLPVYDKPLIYYPLATLMLAGIREILVICRPEDLAAYQGLLSTGENWGLKLEFATQAKPNGIAEAFIIGREFIAGQPCCLILGDNIFFGHNFTHTLQEAAQIKSGAHIFGYRVRDPQRFGVIEFAADSKTVVSLEEKPAVPKSNNAAVGLYFYDGRVSEMASQLKPSARGELEITDLNLAYLAKGELVASRLERGFTWFDAGTPVSLLEASNFFGMIERHQGLKISCPEEIAWRLGWINDAQLEALAKPIAKSDYGQYLLNLPM
jgi:glucose-1-phosphate thymidylyltransferase